MFCGLKCVFSCCGLWVYPPPKQTFVGGSEIRSSLFSNIGKSPTSSPLVCVCGCLWESGLKGTDVGYLSEQNDHCIVLCELKRFPEREVCFKPSGFLHCGKTNKRLCGC